MDQQFKKAGLPGFEETTAQSALDATASAPSGDLTE